MTTSHTLPARDAAFGMKNVFKRISTLEWTIAGCMAGIFFLEINTPRGVAEWVFYSIPLFLTVMSPRKYLPLLVSVVCSVLIVAGFFISGTSDFPARFSLLNRIMGVAFLALSAAVLEHRQRLTRRLQESRETLRTLLRRLEEVREEERTRLARDVHDDLGQTLTAIKMDLRWMERRLETMEHLPGLDVVKARAMDAIGLVDDATAMVQDLASQLRPSVLDRMGLGPAIQGEVRRFQSRVGIPCKTSLAASFPCLVPSVATAVFRILQECLTNVARHAGASWVVVRLGMRGNEVVLRVLDNGSGISPAAAESRESFGLLGMQERAASMGGEVLFHRGKRYGTLVTVRIPNREE